MDTATQAPATDDQELAKVLESMNANVGSAAPTVEPSAPAVDDTPVVPPAEPQFEETGSVPASAPVVAPMDNEPSIVEDPVVETPPPVVSANGTDPELDSIKKDALTELRPLVDKLNLPAHERFDTLLLIIRSTDDKSLVGAAHAAAKAIEDETKRAEALLDVIKEIDYFSNPQK